jgi:hypothetical protein
VFNYFGSKARLAPTYQAPAHDLIIEPFAGAAGYSMYWLQQRSDLRAVLFDSDELVVELWRHLLALEPTDLWSYPLLPAGAWTSDPTYRAAHVSVGSWNKPLGAEYKVTEWMARDFPEVRERMASRLAIVRGRVEIHHGDYTTAPDIEATWFIDPPYQREGHWYGSGNQLDFEALGAWSQARRGQVIICETYGADWMDFSPHVSNQTVANGTSIEAVWYSHPEPTLFDLAVADT